MVKKRGPNSTKRDRRQRAALLSKTCAGPPVTLQKTEEQISKKLSKLQESLAFENRAGAVVSRRNQVDDDDADAAVHVSENTQRSTRFS